MYEYTTSYERLSSTRFRMGGYGSHQSLQPNACRNLALPSYRSDTLEHIRNPASCRHHPRSLRLLFLTWSPAWSARIRNRKNCRSHHSRAASTNYSERNYQGVAMSNRCGRRDRSGNIKYIKISRIMSAMVSVGYLERENNSCQRLIEIGVDR